MEEALIRRIPPHNGEAEKSVIGSMLMNADAAMKAIGILHAEDFYDRSNALIFETMKELNDEGKAIDLITLQNALTRKDLPEEFRNMSFVRDLLSSVPTSANVVEYANIVREKATLRRLISVAAGIEENCYKEQDETEQILDKAEKDIFGVLQQRSASRSVPIGDIVFEALDAISSAAKSDSSVTGLESGFRDLDAKTSGFHGSELILAAARPAMGKTSFVLNIAEYMAFKKNIPCAIFSLEMSSGQLMNRLLSLVSHVDSQKIRTGQLNDSEWDKLVEASGIISGSGLVIDDTPGITIQEFRSRARKYKLDSDIQAIFVDYLQLMAGSGRSGDNRQQEISDISRALKSLARELDIPIIALSQLNRGVETREDHRPMLSDLRESGAIEQDADVVMFIYRDEYYHKDIEENKNIAEIIIAKQRNGPIGTIKLVWIPELTKFANKERTPRS